MSTYGSFIPVIFVDKNDGGPSQDIPFTGHAGFILVNPNTGLATYYEYGPVNCFGIPTATGSNPQIVQGPSGQVRSYILSGTVQYDSSGNITQSSMENILAQITSTLYGSSDPGMVFASPFNFQSSAQFIAAQSATLSLVTNVERGSYSGYSVLSNNCLNFVYNVANACGLTISSSQNDSVVADPNTVLGAILDENPTGVGYEYTAQNSWHGQDIAQVTAGHYTLATFVADQWVQFGKAAVNDPKLAIPAFLAKPLANMLQGAESDYTEFTSEVTALSGDLQRLVFTDGQGNQLVDTFGSTISPPSELILNLGSTLADDSLEFGSIGSCTLVATSSTLALINLTGGNVDFSGETASNLIEIADLSLPFLTSTIAPSNDTFSFDNGTNVIIGGLDSNTFNLNPSATSGITTVWDGGGTGTYNLPNGVIELAYTAKTPSIDEIFSISSTFSSAQSSLGTLVTCIIDPTANDQIDFGTNSIVANISSVAGSTYALEFNGASATNSASILVQLGLVSLSSGGLAPEITIGGSTLLVNGVDTSAVLGTIIASNGLHILDLSPEDSNDFGTDFNFTTDGSGGFIVTDSNGLDIDAQGFDTIITGQGDDTINSSVSDLSFLPEGDYTTIYGSADETDTLDISGTNPDTGGTLFADKVQEYYVFTGGFPGRLVSDGEGRGDIGINFANIPNVKMENGVSTLYLPFSYNPNKPVIEKYLDSLYTITNYGDVSYIGVNQTGVPESVGVNLLYPTKIISYDVGGQYRPVYVTGISEVVAESFYRPLPAANPFYLNSGQGTQNQTVAENQNQNVYNGAEAAGSQVAGKQTVYNSGVAVNTTLNAGATQAVNYGGQAASTTINAATTQIVANNGTASNSTVYGGGAIIADAGAIVEDATVESSGYIIAFAGADVTGTTLAGGEIISGGVVGYEPVSGYAAYGSSTSGLVIGSGGAEYVLPDGVSENDVLDGTQYIYAGGSAVSAALSGGTQDVYAGGVASNTTVYNAGAEIVFSGGSVANTDLMSGGIEIVSSGGVASGVTVNSGGDVVVLPGASVSGVTSSGGNVLSTGVVLYEPHTGYSAFSSVASGQTLGSGGMEYVLSGGTAVTNSIERQATQYVFSGGEASASVINSGGTEYVYSGGSTSNVIVSSGGAEYVSSGGTVSATTVNSGGEEYISGSDSYDSILAGGHQWAISGGIAEGAIVSRGAQQIAILGGTVDNTVVSAGGQEFIESAGTASGTTLLGGAAAYVDFGGAAYGAILKKGQELVGSGGVTYGAIISSGGAQAEYTGGVASNTVISSGGTDYVSGGITYGAIISSGGVQAVYSGATSLSGGALYLVYTGVASNTVISNGGIEYVAGGDAYNTTVDSGGIQYVYASGSAESTTVASGGTIVISSGGVAYDLTIESGGTEIFGPGVTESGSTISSGVTQIISYDGLSESATVYGGGQQAVSSGGVATSATVLSGGIQYVYSAGAASNTTVSGGGEEVVSSGGSSYDANIGTGGMIDVKTGATATGTVISAGGEEYVRSGGSTTSAVIMSGGIDVIIGGTASGVTVSSGGFLIVTPGGTIVAPNVLAGGNVISSGVVVQQPAGITAYASSVSGITMSSGGVTYVLSGGTTTGTTVNNGGQIRIWSGITTGSVINGDGLEFVYAGATVSGTDIHNGNEFIYSGGVASSTTLDGGKQTILSGAIAVSTTVDSGAGEIVSSGGTASSTVVNSGGGAILLAGGTTSNTRVNIGGKEYVSSGGASLNSILSNGVEVVSSGGVAYGTTLQGLGELILYSGATASGITDSDGIVAVSGGSAYNTTVDAGFLSFLGVLSGGTAYESVINSGALDVIVAGGTASGTVINSGGSEDVSHSGTADGATVSSGGTQVVYSGGTAIGTTVSSGGTQTVSSGTASGTVIYGGGNEYVSSGGASFNAILSGGAETVSSGGIAYNTSVQSGEIYVSSGGAVYGAAVESGGSEVVSLGAVVISAAVGYSGTDIVSSGGIAYTTTVSSGGSEVVSSGGTVVGTTVSSGGTETVESGGTAIATTISSGGTAIVSSGGSTENSAISSGGTEILQSGATAVTSGGITFAGNDATLSIGGTFTSGATILLGTTISGFDTGSTTGDEIILSSYTYSSSDSVTLGTGNVLSLNIGGTLSTLQLDPSADYTGHSFYFAAGADNQLVLLDPVITSPDTGFSFRSPAIDTGDSLAQSGTTSPLEVFSQFPDSTSMAGSFAKGWNMTSTQYTLTPDPSLGSYGALSSLALLTSENGRGHYGLVMPHIGSP